VDPTTFDEPPITTTTVPPSIPTTSVPPSVPTTSNDSPTKSQSLSVSNAAVPPATIQNQIEFRLDEVCFRYQMFCYDLREKQIWEF
jgi:hypothetical protein